MIDDTLRHPQWGFTHGSPQSSVDRGDGRNSVAQIHTFWVFVVGMAELPPTKMNGLSRNNILSRSHKTLLSASFELENEIKVCAMSEILYPLQWGPIFERLIYWIFIHRT